MFDKIMTMLRSCDSDDPLFPPTELYNEGWLLRLFFDWFSGHEVEDHPLSFPQGARWFSEALLPSAFLPRSRKDPLGESWTHADGVIGHFRVGGAGKTDLSLCADASHFVVLEAKMFSKLSAGVSHARYFDQAARTVACMAEVLRRANVRPDDLAKFGFYVLAPQSQISLGIFDRQITKESIQAKVKQRVSEYHGDRDQWYSEWFLPTVENVDLGCVSWEELLAEVAMHDATSADEIQQFYKQCLKFNSPKPKPHNAH